MSSRQALGFMVVKLVFSREALSFMVMKLTFSRQALSFMVVKLMFSRQGLSLWCRGIRIAWEMFPTLGNVFHQR